MIKNICILLFIFTIITDFSFLFAQENESITHRSMDSTIDEGFYWDNGFKGRWNPFGAYYLTKIYYRKALSRENNNFWFANSALEVGIEQYVSSFVKTSAFVFWQPIIAINFMFKVGYSRSFVDDFVIEGGHSADYNIAFPPFTGLNPMTKEPKALQANTLEIEFIPTVTFGGKVGRGMLALIYSPHIIYFNNFGIDKDTYIYNSRESIVIKAQDIFFRHDIKFGYSLSGTGLSFAITTLIEHVLSNEEITRVGLFGSVSYERSLDKNPNLIPFFRGQVGTWLLDRYMKQYFAIQIDTGIKWKFK